MFPFMVPQRYLALEGLRGVAALCVVFYHVAWPTHFSGLQLTQNAYLAVDFFFILSGFVIAANYANRIGDARALGAFLTKRFFRLYPLHFVILVALVALETVKWVYVGNGASEVPPFTGPNSPALLIENLLMLQGLGLEDRLGWNPPAWSVGSEFFVYLLFGWVALTGAVRRGWKVTAACAASLVAYLAIAVTMHTLDVTFGLGRVRCIAGFTIGVVIWLYSPKDWPMATVVALVAAILSAIVMAFLGGGAAVMVIPLFIALVAALQYDRGSVARVLSARPTQFLGRISYSIYLTHMPIIYVFTIILKRVAHVPSHAGPHRQILAIASPWVGDLLFAAVIAAVLATSWVTYSLVEEPARLFGRRVTKPFSVRQGQLARAPG